MLFRHESRLPFPPQDVFAWHTRAGAFERLAPPWADIRVRERKGTIRDGDEVLFDIAKGPARFTWRARHREFEEGRRFTDEQVEGPFKRWVHQHHFEPDGEGGTRVLDEIEWDAGATPGAGALVQPDLARTFAFRQGRLMHDLTLHGRWQGRPRLTVALTGGHGLIGTSLESFLTAGGHRVVPFVRSREEAEKVPGAIYWNPDENEIDAEGLRGVDAVVHLAGEPIVQLPRWTAEKKKRILESRVKGTTLISGAIAGMHENGPRTLVSGSAVGYYGDRGDEVLTEDAKPGKGFLADVVKAWEDATRRAKGAGVRVVNLRTGPVLSAAGGMLGKVLIPFRLGLGGRLGSGKQFLPWIDMDDMMGIILHALMDEKLSGPVNACAPNAVTNAAFTDVLGRVLDRPTMIPAPALAIKLGMGEMGEQTLLYGQRARPARLLEAGYGFLFDGIEESLRFQLGRPLA